MLPTGTYKPLADVLVASLTCVDMNASPAAILGNHVKNKENVARTLVQFFRSLAIKRKRRRKRRRRRKQKKKKGWRA